MDYYTAELTKKDNILAVMPPKRDDPKVVVPTLSTNPKVARGMEQAMNALTRPIIDARSRDINNPAFLNTYTRSLFESALPKQLDNNYLTRIDAMIVLGMAGGTTGPALDLYNRVLKDDNQLIWVKMWAAHGLTNAAQSGRNSLDTSKAQLAADALVTFLKSDPSLPYFARLRALEALGSIRIASVNRPDVKLDAASTIAGYLDNPTDRVETRAWAAWALGMLRVPPQITPYNFALVGSDVGRLAVDLGIKIIAEYDAHADDFDDQTSTQAASLTSLLMFQVSVALAGEEGIIDSGLLRSQHPSLGTAKPTLSKIDERVKAVSREAYELLRAGGVAQRDRRNALESRVADLKSFLDQNKPKDRRLVPDGPVLPDPVIPHDRRPRGPRLRPDQRRGCDSARPGAPSGPPRRG